MTAGRSRLSALLLAVLLAGCGGPALEPAPAPDLSAFGGRLRAALEERRAAVGERPRQASAWGELGLHYFAYELHDAARVAFTNAARLAPDDPDWAYYRGVLAHAAGRLDEACDHFETVLNHAGDDLATRLRLAQCERERDRPEAARTHLERALELQRDEPAALYGLGRLAEQAGNLDRAAQLLERALATQPPGSVVGHALGQVYQRQGRSEEARTQLQQAGQVPVSSPDPRLAAVQRIRSAASGDVVRDLLADRDASDRDAVDFAISRLAGDPQAEEGLAGDLPAIAAKPSEDRTVEVRLRRVLAALAGQRGDLEAAIGRLRPATALAPEDLGTHLQLAALLARAGRFEEALAAYDAVLALAPNNPNAQRGRASALIDLGRFDAAVRALQPMLEESPRDGALRVRYGHALSGLGRTQEAIDAYRAATAHELSDEDAGLAHFALGNEHRRAGRLEEAAAAFLTATGHTPEAPGAWLNLGATLGQLGRFDEAGRAYGRAIRLAPDLSEPRRGQAVALLYAGRYREARTRLEEATRALPGDEGLEHLLARLLAAAPDPDVRDPERALSLARGLFERRRTWERAETLALALAATGATTEAARIQRGLLEGVGDRLPPPITSRLRSHLETYERGDAVVIPQPRDLIVTTPADRGK